MKKIWYLLRCPAGNETEYTETYSKLVSPESPGEIVCFQYQRMMRWGGMWHLEKRLLLPGYIFLSGTKRMEAGEGCREAGGGAGPVSLTPCESPYLKELCRDGALIDMSRGVIRRGGTVITSGPLKGRESLIRRIDRHKRIAEIEIPLGGDKKRVIVGLEIYDKQE